MKEELEKKSQSKNRFEELNAPSFLVALLQSGTGQQRAFRRLVELSHGPLLYYVRKFISSMEEAQEVLQEIYLAVHKSLPRFEGKSKLTTWIYGMAHNKICDKLSDRYRQHEEYLDGLQPMSESEIVAGDLVRSSEWDLSPDQVLIQNDLREKIKDAVESLPPQAKEIYHLRDVEGLSGEDVAQILGLSLAAVRVRLHRARNLIVEMVQKMEGNDSLGVNIEKNISKNRDDS